MAVSLPDIAPGEAVTLPVGDFLTYLSAMTYFTWEDHAMRWRGDEDPGAHP